MTNFLQELIIICIFENGTRRVFETPVSKVTKATCINPVGYQLESNNDCSKCDE